MGEPAAESELLKAADLDGLAGAVFYLASQLWAAEERVRILEALVVDGGLVAPGSIDRYRPTGDLAAQLDDRRRQFIAELLDVLVRHREA